MIRNLTRQSILSFHPFRAVSFRDRLRGMIGRTFDEWEADAMVFRSCSCIHTCFMSIPIDVVFLGTENVILKAVPECPPWRLAISCRNAGSVIELPAGALTRTGTQTGDTLELTEETDQIFCKQKSSLQSVDERQTMFRNKENPNL